MVTAMRFFLLFMLCTSLMAIHDTHANERLSAKVDRTSIGLQETLYLEINYSDSTDLDPDLGLLEQHFYILSMAKQRQLRLINGNNASTTIWQLELRPKKAGTLLIPSFKVDDTYSEAITITVTDQPTTTSGDSKEDIFTEMSVEKPSVFIQEQVILSIKLYSKFRILGVVIPDPHFDNLLAHDLGNSTREEYIDGYRYTIYEQKYALFPQQSGEIVIPPQTIHMKLAQQRQAYMGMLHDVAVKHEMMTPSARFEARPVPGGFRGKTWLPAQDVLVSDNLGATLKVKAGDTLTRKIVIKAKGLIAEQLPSLTQAIPDSIKQYPEPPMLNNAMDHGTLTGVRTDSSVLLFSAAGTYSLPALELAWFDTLTGQERIARLPARVITVEASGSLPTATPQVEPKQAPSRVQPAAPRLSAFGWTGYALVITTVGLLTLAYLLWVKKHTARSTVGTASARRDDPSPPATRKASIIAQLELAATQGDARKSREELLRWARIMWPDQNITTLGDIAAAVESPKLAQLLANLDESLYGKSLVQADLGTIATLVKTYQPAIYKEITPSTLEELYK